MKHDVLALLDAAALVPGPSRQPGRARLLTPEQAEAAMRRDLRDRLASLDVFGCVSPGRAKARLAERLKVSEHKLTRALRGAGIGPELAEALGYRRVIRFERVE